MAAVNYRRPCFKCVSFAFLFSGLVWVLMNVYAATICGLCK